MITHGISTTMKPVSLGLVTVSMIRPPISEIDERSAIDRPTPAIDWISVVSVVMRDSTSPVFVTSKNVGSRRITWS